MNNRHVNWIELNNFANEFSLNLEELFSIFFDEAKVNIPLIIKYINDQNFTSVSRLSHLMISSAGSLKFEILEEIFRNLEQNAKLAKLDKLKLSVSHLENEYNLVKTEVLDNYPKFLGTI